MKLKLDFQKRLFKRFWGNNTVYSDSPSNTFPITLLFIKMNDPTSSPWGATRTFRPNFRANRANHAKMRKKIMKFAHLFPAVSCTTKKKSHPIRDRQREKTLESLPKTATSSQT